jgi:hypothetical protein
MVTYGDTDYNPFQTQPAAPPPPPVTYGDIYYNPFQPTPTSQYVPPTPVAPYQPSPFKPEYQPSPFVTKPTPTPIPKAVVAKLETPTPPMYPIGVPVPPGQVTLPIEARMVGAERMEKGVAIKYVARPAPTQMQRTIQELEKKQTVSERYLTAAAVEAWGASPYAATAMILSPETRLREKTVGVAQLGLFALPVVAPAKVLYPAMVGLGTFGVIEAAPKAVKGDIYAQTRLAMSAAAVAVGAYGTYRAFRPTYEVTEVARMREMELKRAEVYKGLERPKIVEKIAEAPKYYERISEYTPEEIVKMPKKMAVTEAAFKEGVTLRKEIETAWDISFLKKVTKVKPEIETVTFLGKGRRGPFIYTGEELVGRGLAGAEVKIPVAIHEKIPGTGMVIGTELLPPTKEFIPMPAPVSFRVLPPAVVTRFAPMVIPTAAYKVREEFKVAELSVLDVAKKRRIVPALKFEQITKTDIGYGRQYVPLLIPEMELELEKIPKLVEKPKLDTPQRLRLGFPPTPPPSWRLWPSALPIGGPARKKIYKLPKVRRRLQYTPTILGTELAKYQPRLGLPKPPKEVGVQALGIRMPVLGKLFAPKKKKRVDKKAKRRYQKDFLGKLGL